MVNFPGSTMGTTVEELKREMGKLKGHIISQVIILIHILIIITFIVVNQIIVVFEATSSLLRTRA